MLACTDMQETLKSNSRLNARTSSSNADDQCDYSTDYLASPKSSRVRKVKSTASSQLPSTKLGLYKALQPLLKLASPSRLDGLVFSYIQWIDVENVIVRWRNWNNVYLWAWLTLCNCNCPMVECYWYTLCPLHTFSLIRLHICVQCAQWWPNTTGMISSCILYRGTKFC